MKKIFAVVLTVILIFSFCSCEEFKKGFEEGFNAALDKVNSSVKRGVIDGDVYESEFTSLKFTKPSDWVYYTDEQIASMLNLGAEELDQNLFEETVSKMQSVYDMMVVDYTSGTNVIIQYENLTISGSASISEENYFHAFEGVINDMEGNEIANSKLGEATLSGEKYLKAEYDLIMAGVQSHQVMYIRKIGGYMAVVIATPCGDVTADNIEAMFS